MTTIVSTRILHHLGFSQTVRRCARIALIVAAGFALQGCMSAFGPAPEEMTLNLLSEGTITVKGFPVALTELPRKLKALGAAEGTEIIIMLPEQYSPKTCSDITSTLASAGFKRILFSKPRHSVAYQQKPQDAKKAAPQAPAKKSGSRPK